MKFQRVTPFLWFNGNAEEAARFYVKIFPNSKIGRIMRTPEGVPGPASGVLTVEFTLDGQQFAAMNGGPGFPHSNAVSFVIHCKNQKEADRYWTKLLAGGGKPQACGWLVDRFGLSWQVTPDLLLDLMMDKDRAKAARVAAAMMKMIKIDIAALKKAAAAPKGKK